MEPTLFKQRWPAASRRDCKIRILTWTSGDILPAGVSEPADETAGTVLCPITLEDLLSRDIKPREFVIEPLIHERGLVMVYAWRGVGKTWFALGLAHAIAAGGKYLKWTASKPRRVLHVCGEMPAVDLKQRFERVVAATNDKPPSPPFSVSSPPTSMSLASLISQRPRAKQ